MKIEEFFEFEEVKVGFGPGFERALEWVAGV